MLDRVTEIARATPGVAQVIAIAGVSALDNNATLANGGVAYIILKDWSERGKAQDLRSLFVGLNRSLGEIEEAKTLVLPPPAIQGIGAGAGSTMQIQLRDGSFDLFKLQAAVDAIVANAQTQSSLQRVMAPFRSDAPQYTIEVNRVKTETVHVTLDQVFSTLAAYVGSSYVDQFNKFGRTFQIYVQADSRFRLRPEDIRNLTVRNAMGDMIPLGTLVRFEPTVGAPLISLYNLYPSATIVALPAPGFSTGQTMRLMEEIAGRTLPPGMGFEWTAMSYQEKLVGNQMYYVFALALLLVYLVLAGQYESWYAPLSVILAVPLSLIGPVAALNGIEDRQQSLCADRPGAADRAVGQECDPDRRSGARAARRRHPDRGSRDGCRARPVPPDPDDVVCLHPRGGAAGGRDRRRRQRPRLDRHHGVLRHAGIDLPGGAVRAVVLCRGAGL